MTTEVNKIIVDPGQWDVLKITKTKKRTTPNKPDTYFSLSLMDLVNSLLYRLIKRDGRKRKTKITPVKKRAICP